MSGLTLLTIGKTHSGKSTFAKEIATSIPNSVILETDTIALFLRSHYLSLHSLDLDHKGSFSDPSLKFLVYCTILEFALKQGSNCILSNSNMYENGRKQVLDIIKKYPGKTIGVYFNYPEEVLFERVKNSQRDTKVLSVSKDFNELIVKQRERFQPPNPSDFDYFFEVTNPDQLSEISKEIIELYKQ
ncbi:MAG: AAA family ATPase [Candidatus Adlerbacteria bacterium]